MSPAVEAEVEGSAGADEPSRPSYEPSAEAEVLTEGWSKSLEDVKAEIVFAGDSITVGGKWKTYFPDASICTIGVSGEDIDELLYHDFLILGREPRKVFLMIGINSMTWKMPDILACYEALLQDLEPVEQVYVQSVLPVRPPEELDNEKICLVNDSIRQLAEEYGRVYIDLHSHFVDEEGQLNEAYSRDGCHINEEGFAVWVDLIRDYIE